MHVLTECATTSDCKRFALARDLRLCHLNMNQGLIASMDPSCYWIVCTSVCGSLLFSEVSSDVVEMRIVDEPTSYSWQNK